MTQKLRIAAVVTILATVGVGTGAALAGGSGCGPFGKDLRAQADRRLDTLHAELKLAPEQAAAWEEFRRAVSVQAGRAGERLTAWRDGPRPVGAIERLERGQQGLDEGRQALAELTAATKRFYATLSREQQQRFDEATRHLIPARPGFRRHDSSSI